MCFSSVTFIAVFLPVVLCAHALAVRHGLFARKTVLLIASAVFYLFAGVDFFACFSVDVLLNFALLSLLARTEGRSRRLLLFVDLVLNVGFLFAAKYFGFFVANVNRLLQIDLKLVEVIAPLGLSFFTFSFVAVAVDVYRRQLELPRFADFCLYVTYFPKLLMGPIAPPKAFLDQLGADRIRDWSRIASGVQLFFFGLFKKAVIADALVAVVNYGFNLGARHSSADYLLAALAYTFQIYYDFSGYTDMAVGVSRMLGIELPMNFDSPYRALSVRDFWKRWHLTLTGFLTKYVYFPLGGSRRGTLRTYVNILVVFIVSGLWHGANWTFVAWGLLHGILMIRDRMMERFDARVPRLVRWGVMFAVTNVLWMLFRSESIGAFRWMISVIAQCDFRVDPLLTGAVTGALPFWWLFALAFVLAIACQNTARRTFVPSLWNGLLTVVAAVWGVCSIGGGGSFVYFSF